MPRKQHLYVFLNKNEFEEYEISTSLVLKYLNQFVIEEEAHIDIIQIHQLQEYRGIPKTATDYFWMYFDGFTGKSPEKILSQNVQRPILDAIETTGILNDDETDNHFIFGRYNDSLTGYLNEIQTKALRNEINVRNFLPLVFAMQSLIRGATNLLAKLIKQILNLSEMSPNNIQITWIDGIRHRLTGEASAPVQTNGLASFVLRKYLNFQYSSMVDVDSLNKLILGDDIEQFFNEMKQGKYVNAGNASYFHRMINSFETQKILSGDKVFLKNFAKTLYDGRIPVFDKDDQLFIEIYCARWTFTVRK